MKNIYSVLIFLSVAVLAFSEPQIVVQENIGKIFYMKYSRDGSTMLLASGNGAGGKSIKICQSDTGYLICTINIYDAADGIDYHGIDYHPSGHFIIYVANTEVYNQRKVKIIDVRSERIIFQKIVKDDSVGIGFTPDGNRFVISYSNNIDVYDFQSQRYEYTLNYNFFQVYNWNISFSQDSRYMCLGADAYVFNHAPGYVAVYDLQERKLVVYHTEKKSKDIKAIGDESSRRNCISPNGAYFVSINSEGWVSVCNVKEKKVIKRFSTNAMNTDNLIFSPDGEHLLISDYKGIGIYNIFTGEKTDLIGLDTFADGFQYVKSNSIGEYCIAVSLERNEYIVYSDVMLKGESAERRIIKLETYSAINGKLSNVLYEELGGRSLENKHIVLDDYIYFGKKGGDFIITKDLKKIMIPISFRGQVPGCITNKGVYWYYSDTNNIYCYNFITQKKELVLLGNQDDKIHDLVVSFDDTAIAYVDKNHNIHVYDMINKRFKPEIKIKFYHLSRISSNGEYLKLNNSYKEQGYNASIFDVTRGCVIAKGTVGNLSPNGKFYSMDGKVYNTSNSSLVNYYDNDSEDNVIELSTISGFSNNGKYYIKNKFNKNTIEIRTIDGRIKTIISGSSPLPPYFNSDASCFFINNGNDKISMYSVETGKRLIDYIVSPEREWLICTDDYYFASSDLSSIKKFVHIVDGMTVTGIDQLAEKLYRPDIIAARLRGDKTEEPTELASLSEILGTGSAPTVTFTDTPSEPKNRDVVVSFDIQDTGGGIGAVYISVNGKIVQLQDASRGLKKTGTKGGKVISLSHLLSLQNGDNVIEAYAMNEAGKIESRHAVANIHWQGYTDKPNLFVLAVGVNKYRDKSLWLNYAEPDALSIIDSFQSAKGGLYGNISVSKVLNENVTRDGIAAAFDELAPKVKADDVFVFYLSGHGTSYTDGDYYFIPVDFRYRNNESIPEMGLSKRFIVENLSKIKSQKTITLLDTCNSGAFISTGQRGMAEKTAIDRLSRATGQATIAASSDTQAAMEGYNGHGIFTYVLLQAIAGEADADNDGYVSLGELSRYVEDQVPALSYEKWGYEQYPQVDLRKQTSFPLVGR